MRDYLGHFYFAIDSDILRALTYIDITMKYKGEKYNFNKDDNFLVSKYSGYFKKLLSLTKNDDVRLLIVNTVYHENKHSGSLIQFMKDYCYFPNVNETNYRQKREEVEELVELYCNDYTLRGELKKAPFIKTYNAHVGTFVASNDCYICAEASVENAIVITANGRHLIFDVKNEEKNSRSHSIANINLKNGYYDESYKGVCVPHPYTISTIGPILSKCDKKDYRFPKSPDYCKKRVDKEITK